MENLENKDLTVLLENPVMLVMTVMMVMKEIKDLRYIKIYSKFPIICNHFSKYVNDWLSQR